MTRPRGVLVIAILALLLGVINLPMGFSVLAGKIHPEDVMGQMPDVGDVQVPVAEVLGWVCIIFSLVCILVGSGLLGLKDWARKAVRVIGVFGLLSALVQMINAFVTKDAMRFLGFAIAGGIYFAVFWYLGQEKVRGAFASSRPPQALPPSGTGSAV